MSAFISSKLIHPPHLFPPRISRTKETIKTHSHSLISTIHPMSKANRFSPDFIPKVTENNAGLVGEQDSKTLPHLKTKLLQQLKGWLLEACLQHYYNLGFKENKAWVEGFHHLGRLFPDH